VTRAIDVEYTPFCPTDPLSVVTEEALRDYTGKRRKTPWNPSPPVLLAANRTMGTWVEVRHRRGGLLLPENQGLDHAPGIPVGQPWSVTSPAFSARYSKSKVSPIATR